ncbi:Gfo/Idh/MocA family protein [Paludibaculum fermentans]|uniref:Gfo/Idh/MocA family oxidoreductase n=1 Tax=Paludibaculum fermentans TaxID=1473598 RepID=A0A7S7NSL0_PALFE|nr:Gfo/Idh/MocA family oxidoreductase [Paludibaculum fermentans]QOY89060.1 Gfo/Idh/MocA family oxidoreductase [Paludibaculum fermentans]
MSKLKVAVIGAGFMGKTHVENLRRLGFVEVAAVAGITQEEADRFAAAHYIPRATGNYQELLADPEIVGVHVCTPNALHAPVAKDALAAGKHVLCEKPLAMSAKEAKEMLDLAEKKKLCHATNHNLRYYPAVQQARAMIANGDLGEIRIVQGTYSQDWLLYDTDFNWRILRKHNGPLRTMGDIGSHWMDMIQHVTGLSITAICADLKIIHKTRKQPKVAIETFAGKTLTPEDYNEVKIDTEDFGMAMLHLGENCRGAYTVSQVSAGCKNRFEWLIAGSKASISWNQEKPDELWIGERNEPNRLLLKDGSLYYPKAASYADYPGGHSEGYDDAHKQLYKRFWSRVMDRSLPIEYPTFADGLRGMQLLEAVIESNKKKAWVKCGPAKGKK